MMQTHDDASTCQSHLNPLLPPQGSLAIHQNLSNMVLAHPQNHSVPAGPTMQVRSFQMASAHPSGYNGMPQHSICQRTMHQNQNSRNIICQHGQPPPIHHGFFSVQKEQHQYNQTYYAQSATLSNGNIRMINTQRQQEEAKHQLSCAQQEIQSLKRTIQNMESTMHANNFRPANVTWMQAACRIRDLEEALSTKEMRLGEKSRRIEVLRLKLDKVNREIEEVRAESLRIQNEVVQNTNLDIFRIREEMEAQKEEFKKEKSQVEEDFKEFKKKAETSAEEFEEFKKNAEIAMDQLVNDHKDQQNHWENKEGELKRELEEKTAAIGDLKTTIAEMREKETILKREAAQLKHEHKIVIAGWSQKVVEIQSATDRKLNEAAEILTQERKINQKEKTNLQTKIESLEKRIHEFEEKEAKTDIEKSALSKLASRSYSKMMSSANKLIRDAEKFKDKAEELGYEIKETPRKRKLEENHDEEDEME